MKIVFLNIITLRNIKLIQNKYKIFVKQELNPIKNCLRYLEDSRARDLYIVFFQGDGDREVILLQTTWKRSSVKKRS